MCRAQRRRILEQASASAPRLGNLGFAWPGRMAEGRCCRLRVARLGETRGSVFCRQTAFFHLRLDKRHTRLGSCGRVHSSKNQNPSLQDFKPQKRISSGTSGDVA